MRIEINELCTIRDLTKILDFRQTPRPVPEVLTDYRVHDIIDL